MLDSWIRKDLDQLEDEAIAKAQEREAKGLALDGSEDHKGSKHYISSGEEVDTSVSRIIYKNSGMAKSLNLVKEQILKL